MSPVQIIRALATASIAAGVALLVTLRMNTGAEPRTSRMSR